MTERKFKFSFLMLVVFAVCCATLIPLKADAIINIEVTLKFIAFPVMILLIALAGRTKKEKEGKVKALLDSKIPMTAYLASAFYFLATLSLRNHELVKDLKLGSVSWMVLAIALIIVALIFTIATLGLLISKQSSEAKKPCKFVSFILFVLVVAVAAFGYIKVSNYVDSPFEYQAQMIQFGFSGLAAIATLVYLILYSKAVKALNKETGTIIKNS